MFENNLVLYAAMFIGTLLFVRISLIFFPKTDVFILGYNVHHLYIGAFLLVLLTPLFLVGFAGKIITLLAGVFSALIVDQIVCLVAGSCNEESYPQKRSLLGLFFFAVIVIAEILILYFLKPLA